MEVYGIISLGIYSRWGFGNILIWILIPAGDLNWLVEQIKLHVIWNIYESGS